MASAPPCVVRTLMLFRLPQPFGSARRSAKAVVRRASLSNLAGERVTRDVPLHHLDGISASCRAPRSRARRLVSRRLSLFGCWSNSHSRVSPPSPPLVPPLVRHGRQCSKARSRSSSPCCWSRRRRELPLAPSSPSPLVKVSSDHLQVPLLVALHARGLRARALARAPPR